MGKLLIQKVTRNRGSISVIWAVTQLGHWYFNIYHSGEGFKAQDIIHFLSGLMAEHPKRYLIVIMDQAPCHTAQKVKHFVLSQKN